MRYFLVLILVLGGVLVGAEIKSVVVKGVEIPVIYEKDTTLPIATMQVSFGGSGSMSDTIEGIAKLTSSLLGEGTKKLGSTKFATLLENRAIHLSTTAGTETFVLELSSLKEEFANAVLYAQDLLKDPNFTKDALEKAKMMTLGKIEQRKSDFDYIASQNLKSELFKNTPLAHPYDGTTSSIAQIKLLDIKNFFKEALVLNRAIVVIGGDVEFEDAKKYILDVLEPLQKGSKVEIDSYEVSPKAKDITVTKETQQAYIYFGAPFGLHLSSKEAYKAKVAAFILGSSGFGSRLMEEVRVKRGLAYSAYCRINLSKSNSYFSGYLQTKLESQKEAIEVVKSEIERFVLSGVSEDELQKAKQFLLGSEPLRVETLSQRLSRSFHEYYGGFELGHSKKELENIEKLTLDELNSFIKKHSEITKLTFSIVTK